MLQLGWMGFSTSEESSGHSSFYSFYSGYNVSLVTAFLPLFLLCLFVACTFGKGLGAKAESFIEGTFKKSMKDFRARLINGGVYK